MKFQKIKYVELNAKQKEIFNFQKVAAQLADYGFNCIKLDDDWQGADFLAYHKDGEWTLKVQLKGRLSIYRKYEGKDLWICFPYEGSWYLLPHDSLVEIVGERTGWLNSASWESGGYSSGSPPRRLLEAISEFELGSPGQAEESHTRTPTVSPNTLLKPRRSQRSLGSRDTHQRAKAKLVEHGYDILDLEERGRLMAHQEETDQLVEVQLKTRISIERRYVGKGLHLCFPIAKADEERWYLIPHDKLMKIAGDRTNWLNTRSWRDDGAYNSKSPSRHLVEGIVEFELH